MIDQKLEYIFYCDLFFRLGSVKAKCIIFLIITIFTF